MGASVTPDLLRRLCSEPEPSTTGTWFLVSLEDLRRQGHTHIEFHFEDESSRPNGAALHTVEEE